MRFRGSSQFQPGDIVRVPFNPGTAEAVVVGLGGFWGRPKVTVEKDGVEFSVDESEAELVRRPNTGEPDTTT